MLNFRLPFYVLEMFFSAILAAWLKGVGPPLWSKLHFTSVQTQISQQLLVGLA